MNESKNIQTQTAVYAQGAELVARGLAMIFGTVADTLSGVTDGMKFTPSPNAGDLENQAEQRIHPDQITMPDSSVNPGTEVDQAEDEAEAQAEPPAKPETKPETPAAPSTNPPAKHITKDDVQRAMAVKVKQLAAKGKEVTLIGTLFPQFHGAQCVSDLTEADYPAFLDELAKL